MYQIFTTTWFWIWSGFDSAVVQSTGKTPVKSNNKNTNLQISRLKYIVSKWVLCHKLLWFYRNIFHSIYFHHGTRWSLWSCGLSQHGTADQVSETQILRGRVWDPGIEIWPRWGHIFYWTKYDSTCKGSEQMMWIKHFSRVRQAPSNCTVPLAALGVCSSMWFSDKHE